MIYLVIILIVSQIIHFIHLQIILSSSKRRLKIIDFQLRNMSQWIVSNQHAFSHHLEEINKVVNSLYVKMRLNELNTDHGRSTKVNDPTTFSWLMQSLNKEPVEKIRQEDIQLYYSMLLQELQQLENKITTASKEAILESPFIKANFLKNNKQPPEW